ncbi:MAG: response regulator [Bacteroidales bacterium]|nr:response regulator [Bacteroidales bacterium]MBN2757036.1 response regulator [Bacteroidales bacterium]
MKTKKILIIEDYDALQEELVSFLQIEGYSTISAKTNSDAINKAIEYKPDLIIYDLEISDINYYNIYEILEHIYMPNYIFLYRTGIPKYFLDNEALNKYNFIHIPMEFEALIKIILKILKN